MRPGIGPTRGHSPLRVGARAGAVAAAAALGLLLVGGGVARAAATTLTVSLSPSTIAADGVSQTTVTLKLSPALSEQSIVLSAPFDPQISFGPVHDNNDGTYTTRLTSSRNAEVTQIFAASPAATEVFPATLTQVGASATSVSAVTTQPVSSSNPPVTNEGVVLLASVAPLTNNVVSPIGTISFQNGASAIAGCQSLPVGPQLTGTASVTCNASFGATSSPAAVIAVFSPAAGSLLAASSSHPDDFPVDRDSTSTSLSSASPAAVGAPVTYVAKVTPGHAGVLAPTGFVRFSDNGTTIGSCGEQPLEASLTATCTVTYTSTGPHAITADYRGDGNFSGSSSTGLGESAQPLGTIDASMQWRFFYTSAYTQVLQLVVSRATPGSRVSIGCRGQTCPFKHHTLAIRAGQQCRRTAHAGCASARSLDLTPLIGGVQLRAHVRVTVSITKPGWTGKAYIFTVRAGLPPTVQIKPVPAGSRR